MSPLSQVRFGSQMEAFVFGKAMRTGCESLVMSRHVAETLACCLQLVNGNFTEGLAATDNDVAGASRLSRFFALAHPTSISSFFPGVLLRYNAMAMEPVDGTFVRSRQKRDL